ncbi:hypothetical protein BH10BAC2_BH10BAC2_14310 [soil metagenome]
MIRYIFLALVIVSSLAFKENDAFKNIINENTIIQLAINKNGIPFIQQVADKKTVLSILGMHRQGYYYKTDYQKISLTKSLSSSQIQSGSDTLSHVSKKPNCFNETDNKAFKRY